MILLVQNIPLDADVYNAAMAACMDDIERFDQLRSEMRQDKIPTNASSLVITTNVCESNSMFEEAFLVQKDLLNRSSSPVFLWSRRVCAEEVTVCLTML